MEVIHPIILEIPDALRELKRRAKVAFLGRAARQALAMSCRVSGRILDDLKKDDNGAPLPVNGTYWSISHKSEAVAGVVSGEPVGIDIETIRPVSDALCRRIAQSTEWELLGEDRTIGFFRIWTAKEAVLKAEGVGFKGFSNCGIRRVVDRRSLIVSYGNRRWMVAQWVAEDRLAAVARREGPVHWHPMRYLQEDSCEK